MLRIDPIAPPSDDLPRDLLGPDDRDSLDTDAILRFFRKRRRLCLAWLVAGLGIGIAYMVVMPASYTAGASILLEDRPTPLSDVPVATTDAANSTYVETQVQVLESDEVVGRVVDEQRLTEDDEFGKTNGTLRALLKRYVRPLLASRPAAAVSDPRYATLVLVRRKLTVQRVGTSDVVEIKFTARSPALSATIANAIIQSYIDGRLVIQRNAHEEALSRLWERLAELRDKAFPLDSPQDTATATPETALQARARFREQQDKTETYRALYGRLLQRAYSDADVQLNSAGVRVITPAEPPLIASSQFIIFAAFIVLGGIVGVGHALIRELTDHTLTMAEDVLRLTGIDRIASIPQVKGQTWKTDAPRSGHLQLAYVKSSAIFSNALAKVAVRLRDGQRRRNGWVIGVASPTDGTGASSIAAHLARMIAESGQQTILVDANWRKPMNGHVLPNPCQNRKLASGLSTVHLDAASLDILILRATAPTAELNAALSIVSTIELLRPDYDCIVVDFHASTQTADLAAGTSVADELVVVAEARRTTSASLTSLLRELPSSKIATLILNKV